MSQLEGYFRAKRTFLKENEFSKDRTIYFLFFFHRVTDNQIGTLICSSESHKMCSTWEI